MESWIDRNNREFKQELKRRMAKRYIEERGLSPVKIGAGYVRPYTPPVMGRDAEQLQRFLLMRHD